MLTLNESNLKSIESAIEMVSSSLTSLDREEDEKENRTDNLIDESVDPTPSLASKRSKQSLKVKLFFFYHSQFHIKNAHETFKMPSTASEACVATAIRDFYKSYPFDNPESQFELEVDESNMRKCNVKIVSHST